MKASEADALKRGDIVIANFGGFDQWCQVQQVVKEPRCRRIYVRFIGSDQRVRTTAVTHRTASLPTDDHRTWFKNNYFYKTVFP